MFVILSFISQHSYTNNIACVNIATCFGHTGGRQLYEVLNTRQGLVSIITDQVSVFETRTVWVSVCYLHSHAKTICAKKALV
jgi:hypothetical protein